VISVQASDMSVECDGTGNTTELNAWLASNGGAQASDNCSNVTWSNDFTSISDLCGATGSATVTFTATDECGNSASTSAVFSITDDTDPVISVQASDLNVECDGAGNTTELNAWLASNGGAQASDNCSNVTWSNDFTSISDLCGATGSATVTFTATDECGNSASTSAVFSITDDTDPVISVQASDLNVECDGAGNTTELNAWLASNGGAQASDNCSNVTWSNDFTSISDLCGATGSATVTFTATDDCGNSATTSATFTITDNTAPVVTCPADINVMSDPGTCGATILVPQPAYTENCSSVSIINSYNSTPDASGFYPTGTTVVTWTVTDECGNSATCSMNITVTDNELPVIICPSDITVCSTDTVILGVATATDNCGIASVVNNAPASFPVGTTIVVWTATDISGNTATCQQTVTINPMAIANAGDDDVICQYTSGYQVTGATAQNYTSLLWTSTGSGTLLNPTTLNPTYVPQFGETGNVYLTLTAYGIAPCADVTDQMLLSVIPAPIVSAGVDDSICEGEVFIPVTAYGGYYNSLLWTTSGSGSFSNPSILNPVYTPGNEDIINGGVTLTLTAFGSVPCGSTSDVMTLSIFRAPVAVAGPDDATCMQIPFTVTGASAQQYDSIYWTHTGTGVLSGANTLVPTYTPAPNESGVVTLTLHATGNAPCGNADDSMDLTIFGAPTVFAGNDASSCNQDSFMLSEATATNALSLIWNTSGTGTFDNPSILNSVYYPSAEDVSNGSVILTLTANGNANCGIASDGLTLTLNPGVTVDAGEDTITCSNMPVTILGASSGGAAEIHWTHNGTGTLTGDNTISPTYIPGENESGTVTLEVLATGIAPCGTVTDQLLLDIIPAPVIDAGPALSACDQFPVTISTATASNYTSLTWTTSGSGTFTDATSLNTVYTPSEADADAGTVVLTLTVTGNSPCSQSVDSLTLNIQQSPHANAGPDVIECSGNSYTVTGASADNYTSLLWSHSGTGSLQDATTLNPTYIPGTGEYGSITLTLTLQGTLACASVIAADQMILTISQPVIVNAGTDQTIATGTTADLSGSVSGGSGFFAYNWEPAALTLTPGSLSTATVALSETTAFVLTGMDLSTGCSSTDTVIIRMGSANLPPVAVPDFDTASVLLPAIVNVLDNDSDPDGYLTSVSITTYPLHGIVTVDADNTITYVPESGFEGIDTFIYQVCDNGMPVLCDTALVTITVYGQRPFDNIIIHDYLSPNSDGYNDTWIIENIQYWPDNEVLIFNRWGDKIQAYNHYDNSGTVWNGTNDDGKRVPDGTYYYIVKVRRTDPVTGEFAFDTLTGYIMVRNNR